jgi:hypothetical protein
MDGGKMSQEENSVWRKPEWLYATYNGMSRASNNETLIHLSDIRNLARNIVMTEKTMYVTKEYFDLELEEGDLLEIKCFYHKQKKGYNIKFPETLRNRSAAERKEYELWAQFSTV